MSPRKRIALYGVPFSLSKWQSNALLPLPDRIPFATAYKMAIQAGCTSIETPEKVIFLPPPHFETDHALLLLTSGSSGPPKIALFTEEALLASAQVVADAMEISSTSRYHIPLPLTHVGGIGAYLRCCLKGATPFTPLDTSTHASFVPTQLFRLNHLPPSLQYALVGGAPPGSIRIEGNIHLSYGMTELASTIALDGWPLPHIEMRIEGGELWVRGPSLFSGYWNEGAIELPLREGFFPTGDLVHFDKGRLEWMGRKDNLFISGGENIQPEEIELLLKSLPSVFDAYVVAKPDPEWGARPVAFLDADPFDPLLWKQFLGEHLPRYKIPVAFHRLPPQTGKANRPHLTKLAKELSESALGP